MSTLIDRFEWSGGHPALDFVNTLDDRPFERPVETLETYQDLVLFTELAGLIEPAVAQRLRARAGPSCLRIVTRARALREHLFAILTAVHAGEPASRTDLERITVAALLARAAQVLVAQTSSGLASYRWLRPAAVETPLHACALAVEDLLVMDVEHGRIRSWGRAGTPLDEYVQVLRISLSEECAIWTLKSQNLPGRPSNPKR